MLETLRKSAGSWIAKILFGLLVVSFGVWGIGDFVKGGASNVPAIQVGDVKYAQRTVREEFNRDVSRLRNLLGPQFTAEEARRMGMMSQTVQRLVTRATVEMASRDLGLVAPDALVRRIVETRPEFQAGGRFDRDRFRQILAANGYTEEGYLELLRGEIIRTQLMEPITQGAAAPGAMVDALYRHRNEKRVAEVVTVAASTLPAPPPPDRAALEAFHGAHAESFTAPEYRTLSLMVLTPSEVAADVKIGDEAIAEVYAQRGDEFRTPERRNVDQVLFDTMEQADSAVALVKQGRPLKDAATTAAGKAAEVQNLGWVTRADMPDPVADAVFALKDGDTGQPVQTALGWHVFTVRGIQVETVTPLEQARKTIEQELAKDKAVDLVYELSSKVEDALASGSGLDDVAQKLGLKLVAVSAIDRTGLAPDGKPPANLPKLKELLPTAFTIPAGKESSLVESDDGYFVVRVDDIAPSRLRPLDEVRAQVVAQWVQAQRDEAARKKAETVLQQLRTGENARAVAGRNGAALAETKPMTRTGDNSEAVPMPLVAELFKLKPGEAGITKGNDGYVAARLKAVVAATPDSDPTGVAAVANEVRTSMGNDLAAQFTAALGQKFTLAVNRQQIEE